MGPYRWVLTRAAWLLQAAGARADGSEERDEFLELFGDVLWQPQLLLRGNATRLRRYLDRFRGTAGARKPPRRPLAFNRPVDPDAARAAFAHASRGGWPRAVAHPKLQSDSRLAGGGQLWPPPRSPGAWL